MLLKELFTLNEASTPRRAWNGKLKNIDALMSWMYSKGILTATEQKQKDKVFSQYYRYYNDGDIPAALKVKGISKMDVKYTPDKVEKELEEYLETFIKKILGKYLPKIDRVEFKYDNAIKDLKVVKDVAENDDAYGLLTYWLKKTKIPDDNAELAGLVSELDVIYKKLRKQVDAANPKGSNTVLSYLRSEMKKDKTWTADFETQYAELSEKCADIASFIGNIITGFKKLQTLRGASKL